MNKRFLLYTGIFLKVWQGLLGGKIMALAHVKSAEKAQDNPYQFAGCYSLNW